MTKSNAGPIAELNEGYAKMSESQQSMCWEMFPEHIIDEPISESIAEDVKLLDGLDKERPTKLENPILRSASEALGGKMKIWITRDAKCGDDPNLVMIHALKPTLDENGNWSGPSLVIPEVKHGKCKKLEDKSPGQSEASGEVA